MSIFHHVKKSETCVQEGMIHFILSHSYVVFFIAVILGSIFHIYFNLYIFSGILYPYIGFMLIILGSLLIYISQQASAGLKKTKEGGLTTADFEQGPYKYSRNPTHIGMTVMTLGLGLLLNSFFMVFFILCASVITKQIFLKEEEILLEQKYGQAYSDYKKKVGKWI